MVNFLCGGMHVQSTISMCKIKVRKIIIMNVTKYIMCILLHENFCQHLNLIAILKIPFLAGL